MHKVRQFLFRWRGALMLPIALLFLVCAQPSFESFSFGLGLALFGELLRLWALGYTGEHTRSQDLEAPELVQTGPYAFVRNPLYLGNLLNSLAVAVAAVGNMPVQEQVVWVSIATIFTGFLYGQIILLEESFLREKFGAEYEDYAQRVPAVLPKGWNSDIAKGRVDVYLAWTFERSTLVWWLLIWSYMAYKVL